MKKYYRSFIILFVAVLTSTFVFGTSHIISVGDFAFSPSNLNVMVGDTIVWNWHDGNHTTTSDVIPSGAASWNVDMDGSSNTFQYVITVAGAYSYYCIPHQFSGMVGTFIASGTAGISKKAFAAIGFKVFQNPSDGSIHLRFEESLNEPATFTLMDLSGKVVFSNNSVRVEKGSVVKMLIGILPSGIYLAGLNVNERREVKRIILY